MKLVLASYFQPEWHGEGRKVGISAGKPKNSPCECDVVFQGFVPANYWEYQENKRLDPDAGAKFVSGYTAQLEKFVSEIKAESEKQGKTVQDLLPFKDGDTLLSWENKGNTSYRGILAKFLKELGYEVVEN